VRTIVHLGDVAFAHDAGSLLTWARLRIPLTVLLVDNGGGRIFDRLPVATQTDAYEEHVLTPTGLDLAAVARAYGLPVTEPGTLEELRAALREPGLVLVRPAPRPS
jgi:2-succinyl-5-enolpyruvyl-6-hydroxy-3-cyclohexene-1-carboxylate synthase